MPQSSARVNVNLLAPLLILREAAECMRKTRRGTIINISSLAVRIESVGDTIYAATKAGSMTMPKATVMEFGAINVTCTTLAKVAIETEMLRQIPRAKIDRIVSAHSLHRLAIEAVIINVIQFFALQQSGY